VFIRYRKLIRGGEQPRGVQAKIACSGQCQHRYRWTMGGPSRVSNLHCPVKPRCRWRIGLDPDGGLRVGLVPYRLQVQLIENRREGSQVLQEHVATLGAVDAWFIPEFWADVDPAITAKVKADDWETQSIIARTAFWDSAKPRLDRLVNRLDPKAFRLTIHQRIPWPMQNERDLAEARSDFRFWQGAHEGMVKQSELHREVIQNQTKQLAETQEKAAEWGQRAAKAALRLTKL
jgi:hypothetical protein